MCSTSSMSAGTTLPAAGAGVDGAAGAPASSCCARAAEAIKSTPTPATRTQENCLCSARANVPLFYTPGVR
jgi:hypothetical protein